MTAGAICAHKDLHVGLTLVSMAMRFGLGAEIQSPTSLLFQEFLRVQFYRIWPNLSNQKSEDGQLKRWNWHKQQQLTESNTAVQWQLEQIVWPVTGLMCRTITLTPINTATKHVNNILDIRSSGFCRLSSSLSSLIASSCISAQSPQRKHCRNAVLYGWHWILLLQ